MKALYNNRRHSKIPHSLLGCLALFFVSTVWSQNIQQLEYFFGTDPGIGNATMITANANTGDLTQDLTLPLTGLQEGFHRLTLRSKDTNNTWGLYQAVTFYISTEISGVGPVSNIAGAEYWFDADPGFGNGTALTISGAPGETTLGFAIPLGTLELGFHNLELRTKNLDGTWSLFEKKIFYIFKVEENQNPSALTGVEFLYDTELGYGSGTLANITATGNTDEYLVEIPTNLVSCDIHDVWLSVKNADGNYSLYQIALDVDIYDNLAPTIVVFPNITATLDAAGETSISIDDVNNGTYDDCQLVSVVLNQPNFFYTCENLGANMVTITATDAENKVSSQNVTINVVDTMNPVAVAQNIFAQLGANGSVTVSANDLNNGSTDNCDIASYSINTSSFSCDNLGENTVILSVTDVSGNIGTATAIITIVDSINPTAIGHDITVDIDGQESVTIAASDVDNGSSDNCGFTLSIDQDTFTMPGSYDVLLTITDTSRNQDSVYVKVTVIGSPLGMTDENLTENSVKVFPVPTKNLISIVTKLDIKKIDLIDVNGRTIFKYNGSLTELNLSDFASGVYFLKLRTENQSIIKRIIKQ